MSYFTLPLRGNENQIPISLLAMLLKELSLKPYDYIKPQKLVLSTYLHLFHLNQGLYSKKLERIYYTELFIIINFI